MTNTAEAVAQAFAAFSEDYTVYLFDQRTNIPEVYSIQDMAHDTAAVMQTLGIDKADLFGASLGGMMAQCIALEHPDMCGKLVLGTTASACCDETRAVVSQWIQLAKDKKGYALNEAFAEACYSENTLAAYRAYLLAAGNDISDEELERFVIRASAIFPFDIRNRLNEITCPVLVLGCEGDKVTTPACARETAAALNCKAYYYGREYGHCVFDEAPDYRSQILDFLK